MNNLNSIVDYLKVFNNIETYKKPEPRTMAQEPRIGLEYAGIVKQGPNTGKHKYVDFYPKGTEGSTAEWFASKPKMNKALQKRKEVSGRGLSPTEMTTKYKKFLEGEGFKTWAEADNKAKDRMTNAYRYSKGLDYEIKGRQDIKQKTIDLLESKKPINSRTGLPYTIEEYKALTEGQKGKLLRRLQGKEPTRAWEKRQGWYPEKKPNKLMTYLKHAAKKQENLPLKERNFINVLEGEKFVGVKDVRKNTLWTHIDYDLSKTGAKKGTVITKHPSHKNIQYFLEQAGKFKFESPDKLLESYFTKYKRVPTYSEMYRFFTVDPQTAGAKTGTAYKINPLQQHHQELMAKEPARSIQLTLSKQNTEASRILNQFEKGNYSLAEANKRLNEIGVRIKGSKGWMGPAKGEITTAKSIEAAQAETIKMFKDAYKNNPKIVNQMTKALNIAKKAKGPGRLKALQYLITLGGAGFVTALGFSPTEVQAAEAEAAEPGAAADMSKWLFESGLTFGEKAKVIGTAAIGDWAVNKSKLSKAFLKGLPFLWTPGGNVAWEAYSHFSKTEPKLEDFAEGFKAGGYDINSEEFKNQWNSIPEQERKEMLYNWSGMVLDQRSTSEKIKETAASPWTHAEYAFWKHGVESMQKLLKANPGSSALINKLKQATLFGIRMGIPMRVISAISPVGWALTGATAYSAIQQEFEGKMRKTPLTEPEQMDIQKRKTAVPTMLNVFDQASQAAKEQGISYEEALKQVKADKPLDIPGLDFKIDYSLPKNFAGGGPVRLTRTVAPGSEGIMSLKKKR